MSPFFAALMACSGMGVLFVVTGWLGRAAREREEAPQKAIARTSAAR
jgi:hypothetical protein